jgi:hypothetical protein
MATPIAQAKNKHWFGVRDSYDSLDRAWTVLSLASGHAEMLLRNAEELDGDPEADVQNDAEAGLRRCLRAPRSLAGNVSGPTQLKPGPPRPTPAEYCSHLP